MKILHTSDWHLGKRLERASRYFEQCACMQEIVKITKDAEIDLVLIAGDIFDTFSPSGEAESLFYDTVSELSQYAAVAVIPGNHDDPAKLCASEALAERNGIFLLGDISCPPKCDTSKSQIAKLKYAKCRPIESGLGYIKLATDTETAVLAFLPYPLDSRLANQLGETISKEEKYSLRVKRWLSLGARHFSPKHINIAMSHLFVSGSDKSGDEFEIELGTAKLIEKECLPNCDYLALGHVHKNQAASRSKNAYYSGSILAYSFSDTLDKYVNIVELAAGKPALIKKQPLTSGKPLVMVEVDSLDKIDSTLASLSNSWVQLTLNLQSPLLDHQSRELSAKYPFVVKRFLNLPATSNVELTRRTTRSPREIFAAFYKSRRTDEPDPELVNLFVELMEDK